VGVEDHGHGGGWSAILGGPRWSRWITAVLDDPADRVRKLVGIGS